MRNFDKRLRSLPESIWEKVGQIEALRGQWTSGVSLSAQLLGRLKRSVLVTSTGASTRIEGSQLSDEDVEKFIRGLAMQKFTARDKQEVRGYYELLTKLFENWPSIRFSESTIKHLHKELLLFSEKDRWHRGDYKTNENRVEAVDGQGNILGTIFKTTPPYLTAKEMGELIEWTERQLRIRKYNHLLVVGNFLVEFLNIHPFQDGNGRLARILTNFFLLKEGYVYMPYVSHEKIIEDNKDAYYLALRQSQKTINTKNENITPWLEFFLTVLLKQSMMAIDVLNKQDIEKLLSPKQLSVWQYLQAVSEATPQEISQKTKVARPTVNQALTKLLSYKKIERLGLGRAVRYKKL
ncbi:MAG: Fic family protein [Patescibacteria group bacterium]|nr:MAG: Fic family protein [Patescibacteria group bacterium]